MDDFQKQLRTPNYRTAFLSNEPQRQLTHSDSMESSRSALRARIWVAGRVQGVAYRAFAWEAATDMGLKGGVRNLDDGRVEVEVEGEHRSVESFLEILRAGPPGARVDDVRVEWESPTGQWADFQVWY